MNCGKPMTRYKKRKGIAFAVLLSEARMTRASILFHQCWYIAMQHLPDTSGPDVHAEGLHLVSGVVPFES